MQENYAFTPQRIHGKNEKINPQSKNLRSTHPAFLTAPVQLKEAAVVPALGAL